MFLTPRETIILKELLHTASPVTVEHLMSLLKVSKRTVYRELANLELSLESIGAKLEKAGLGRFRLIAEDSVKTEILSAVSEDEPSELSATERQHAILLQLLNSDQPISMQTFLDEFLISNTTFFADIKQLETRLARLPLTITRNRGYELAGSEKYRRLLLANILGIEINEYHFFHFSESKDKESFFLQFVNQEQLLFAQKLVREIVEPRFSDLSDRKLEFLILMLTIAMDRVPRGHQLVEDSYAGQINKELLDLAKQIFAKIAAHTKQLYAVSEVVFFANLLGDFSKSLDDDFFKESFDTRLAYQVKQLIENVSRDAEVNFFEDPNLYKMLLTHLSGALSRAILNQGNLNNPILERIMAQYSEVASAIRNALPQVFPQQQFSEEEIAYMVLHFANSLERSPKVIAVDIAGISPSGLASTRMLEMRLRKHFPFINDIVFFRIADLGKLNLEEKFDLTISTSLLPGYSGKYLLVSPLLLEDEVKQLKEAFRAISHTKRNVQLPAKPSLSENDDYQEVMTFIDEINQLLKHFFVKPLENNANVFETVSLAVKSIAADTIADPATVRDKLMNRYQQAPIGIPNTHFALFHASHAAVLQPCFCVFDLKTPLEIMGMDKKTMTLSRMLVMLAPDPIEENVAKMLGKISGAIIMNDLGIEIFNSGNEAIIYQLLSALLIEEVKK
ncbi:phosphoenolpyruvate-dependent sugar phosphotransferase system eiia 2 [Trichococcus palustris]|uniref:Phosphoenolpyruvate-dependent sugar phosphotransferase system eiia 2 n=1 Tax=Trichococcus palustris TaxID=140314 RepID=A0A143YXR6_9LACT|nr:BglG family transcription antiterminator [Trichococcus palustris]CZR01178.1 phosphoenolpyruvate-dependent sugar phosphotransferase system eiia 2 [Trichococcus palustris]SFL07601.1 mannitol operon transcriptional antiterminator [Trichococcus palustris]